MQHRTDGAARQLGAAHVLVLTLGYPLARRYWGKSRGEGSCSDDTVSQIWSLHIQPQERCRASLAPGLHASFRQQSIISWGHRLRQANTNPRASFIWWASINFGWKGKLSHQEKLFLKLLGSLPSTTHLLPWRGVLITRLPPGEDNDGAAGHAEPAGLLSSDPLGWQQASLGGWEMGKWSQKQPRCHTLSFPCAEI